MPAAWTTPRTWTAGELVTAAIGNSAWRDNLLYLKDSPTFDQNVTVTGTTLLTGVATFTAAPVFSSATASQAVFTNGSKALVSNAITGTGNVVMSASPTLTGTIAGAAMTLSSTLGVTGATTLSSTVATGALTVTGAATYTTSLKSTTALATPAALTATQATAFASTVSGAAIMGFGTTNDVSLMNRAGTVVLGVGPNTTTVNMTGALSVAGLLTVSGFGTSIFSAGGTGGNRLQIKNTNAGTGNLAGIDLFNDSGNLVEFWAHSSTYTTSGPNVANGVIVNAKGVGGLSISTENASGAIRFYSGGTTERGGFDSGGTFYVKSKIDVGAVVNSATSGGGSFTSDGRNGPMLKLNNSYIGGAYNLAEFYSNGSATLAGYISNPTNNTVGYVSVSDRRLKRELRLASDVSALRSLVIHDFEWVSDGHEGRGVFAQDAYLVLPRDGFVAVGTDELMHSGSLKAPWGVDYGKVVPDLIVGWQQHDATITQLAARIAALETKDH